MSDKTDEFVKSLIKNVTNLRRLMEDGFFIIKLRDISPPEMAGIWISSFQWALCKHPTPKDSREGLILFDNYSQAYDSAVELIGYDKRSPALETKGIVRPLSDISSLRRKLSLEDVKQQVIQWEETHASSGNNG